MGLGRKGKMKIVEEKGLADSTMERYGRVFSKGEQFRKRLSRCVPIPFI
jgi:hypothetical protein